MALDAFGSGFGQAACSDGSDSDTSSSDTDADAPQAKRARANGSEPAADNTLDEWAPPALAPPASPAAPNNTAQDGRTLRFRPAFGEYPTTVYIPVVLSEQQTQAVRDLVTALRRLLPDLKDIGPVSTDTYSDSDAEPSNGSEPGRAPHETTETFGLQQRAQPAVHAVPPPAGKQVPTADTARHNGRQQRGGASVADAAIPRPAGAIDTGLHVSLSRCLPVRYAQLETLLGALRDELQPKAQRFSMQIGWPECFVNEEGTRTFVSLPVIVGKDKVCRAIKGVDRAFQIHSLQTFYEDPRPHVSIAWLQGSQQAAVETALATLRDERSRHGKRDFCVELVVSRVLCRVGKHDHVVWSDGSQGS